MASRTAGAVVTTLVAAGAALVLLETPVPARQQVFRVAADVVTLPVTVTARGGALVAGLQREQFAVLEDGTPQVLSYFATGATPEVPVHLGLLLDTSGSMQRDLASATSAAIRFVNQFEEARDVTFVDFSTQVRVSRFEPGSYPHLFARIRDNTAEGYTALYDAVAMYLAAAEEQPGQKVLLLYTDGGDSRSTTSFSDVIEMLRLSQVIVYVIGYVENQPNSSRMIHQMRMNDIAHQTGGAVFYPSGRADLDRIYARILDELNGRYTLGYTPANSSTDGRWRKVQVRVNAPDVRGLTVRTRPGYYAPVR
jgi:Ca-activated chloride channel family protein